MPQIHEFKTANAAGGRQFVAHKIHIGTMGSLASVWFSDTNGGTLVDAEIRIRNGTSRGVRRSSPQWVKLEKLVPSLIAAHDRESAE